MNEQLQGDLRHLLQVILNMPVGSVRPAGKNQPTEGEIYAVLQVQEMSPTGWGESGEVIKQLGVATLTIDFLGKGSLHYASQLPMAMRSFYAINAMASLNLGYMSCTAARDLTALEFERKSRHQVKMMVSYSTVYDKPDLEDWGNIEKVDIELYVEP